MGCVVKYFALQVYLERDYIMNDQYTFTYEILGLVSYPDYVQHVMEERYLADLYTAWHHDWTLGLFFQRFRDNLDSLWMEGMIDGRDVYLQEQPLQNCVVDIRIGLSYLVDSSS